MADPNRNVGRSCPTRARSLVRRYIEERPLEARRLDRDETRALRRRRVPFDQCSELGDGRRFEQRRQQHLATDRSLDAREHSHGIERVAAQLGEVVVDTDVVTTQNVRPDRREGAFELVRRRSLLDDDLARVPLRQGDRCVEPGEPRRRATPPDTRLRSPPMELSTSARHCRGPRPTNRPSPVGLRARRRPSWRPRAPASAPSSWPVRLRRAPTARHRPPPNAKLAVINLSRTTKPMTAAITLMRSCGRSWPRIRRCVRLPSSSSVTACTGCIMPRRVLLR